MQPNLKQKKLESVLVWCLLLITLFTVASQKKLPHVKQKNPQDVFLMLCVNTPCRNFSNHCLKRWYHQRCRSQNGDIDSMCKRALRVTLLIVYLVLCTFSQAFRALRLCFKHGEISTRAILPGSIQLTGKSGRKGCVTQMSGSLGMWCK